MLYGQTTILNRPRPALNRSKQVIPLQRSTSHCLADDCHHGDIVLTEELWNRHYSTGNEDLAELLNYTDTVPVRTHFWERASQETRDHADSIAQGFAEPGANVGDIELPTDFDEILWAHRILLTTEGTDAHRDWFDGREDDYSPNVRGAIEDGLKASAVDFLMAKEVQTTVSRDVSDAMGPFNVVMTPPAAPRDLSTTDDPMSQSPFTFGGFPTISLPPGFDSGSMPLGVQLGTPHWEESRLLSVAA